MRKEQCAYKILPNQDLECDVCEGYDDNCTKYTTIEHVKKFYDLFGEGNGKLENELWKNGD